MTDLSAWVKGEWEGNRWVLMAGGRWDIIAASRLEPKLRTEGPDRPQSSVRIDLSQVTSLDTAGVLLVDRVAKRLRTQGHQVEVTAARPEVQALVDRVHQAAKIDCPKPAPFHPLTDLVTRVGMSTVMLGRHAAALLSFLGLVMVSGLKELGNPSRIRFKPFVYHVEKMGMDAIPIVGLLSFLIGVVLAYQGADQLRQFGAEIFVVNLLGISILREIGVLLTAIIVAGRTGSAITAQIGTMKVNQEVDAMQTLGLDPVDLLVLPRVLALMVALPLLVIYANVVAIAGGAVMAYFYLDITFGQFLKQLQLAVTTTTLFVGLVKAPVFALVIALVGCYEGLRVTGSAESVGLLTTRSVVASIFLVIVLDAIFSVFFSFIGLGI